MNDVWLAVIGVAVAVMAVIQVCAMVIALRAARRVDDAVTTVERAVARPAREVFAMVQGLIAAFMAFREGPASAVPTHPVSEEEDSLFIG